MTPASEVPSDLLWRQGWYRFARRLDSPNFGARPNGAAVELLIIHSISLPPGQYGTGNVQRLFTNQLDWNAHPYFKGIEGLKVSAHFFVTRGGDLWQFVSTEHRAWHAGVSSHDGRADCNDFSIGIELEGLEGETFEAPQYETLSSLCAALGQRYPVRQVVGHEHVAPQRKRDPGAGFDWARLALELGWPAQCFPC